MLGWGAWAACEPCPLQNFPPAPPRCSFQHSRLSAIMGPSGAGKTTFLNVLMGKAGDSGRQVGRVLVNGREMRMEALRSITGFVPQEVRRWRQGGGGQPEW